MCGFPTIIQAVERCSLFLSMTRSASRVSMDGDHRDRLSHPVREVLSNPGLLAGSKRFIRRIPRETKDGAIASPTVATRAVGVMISLRFPRRHASTIWRAARCALIETTGMEAAIENQANSCLDLPLNDALT